ncbi:MAG TPA: shikimate dehydrogenase [Nitrolancea sp.]|nr:shikimate dehydrogenase [Nitrolancea sp.]
MLRVGLIGFPVEHSLSPAFQQAAFDALGLDIRYELWTTTVEELAGRVEGLRASEFLGANVTVPYKERAFSLMESVSDIARRAGAVNTIVKRGNQLHGENTDVAGFLSPLLRRGLQLREMNVIVLGAGGAARGVVVALQSIGCEQIVVANRTVERARILADQLAGAVEVSGLDDTLTAHAERADLLVNATSLGWDGDRLPLDETALRALKQDALVYDLTYRATPLLRAAQRFGHPTLDGLEMLVAQGAESFRLWTGEEPPFELMLSAAHAAQSV